MKQTVCGQRLIWRSSIGTWLVTMLLLPMSGSLLAQDAVNPPVDAVPGVASEDPATGDHPRSTAESDSSPTSDALAPRSDTERKRRALAGLAAVGAIAILGVGIIAGTMVWARRLRRLARNMGPPQRTIGNDFWFLKPPKPVASDSELPNRHRPPHGKKQDEPE